MVGGGRPSPARRNLGAEEYPKTPPPLCQGLRLLSSYCKNTGKEEGRSKQGDNEIVDSNIGEARHNRETTFIWKSQQCHHEFK